MIINLKDYPEIARVIRAASPSYKKHKAIIRQTTFVAISGTAWDGGSRSTYTAVNLATLHASAAPQYNPPQFGGPKEDPRTNLPEGVVIVSTGTFCGKTATATVYINPANVTRMLPNAVVGETF